MAHALGAQHRLRAGRPFTKNSAANHRVVVARSAPTGVAQPARPAGDATTSTSFTYTNYESNSFAVKFDSTGVSVLVDPWLLEELVFADSPWIFRGQKRMLKRGPVDLGAIAAATDLLLITQGLPDHFHVPTLKALPKTLPVVANPETAAMARELGFSQVTSVDHGQTVTVAGGRLQISGTKGALVGPPWSKRQSGFVLREQGVARPVSIYFEPHCDFDAASVAAVAPVDVVVSPVCSQLLNLGVGQYPLVQGDISLVELLRLLRPKVLVPLPNAEIDMQGPLSDMIVERGSLEGAVEVLQRQGVEVRVEPVDMGGQSRSISL